MGNVKRCVKWFNGCLLSGLVLMIVYGGWYSVLIDFGRMWYGLK